MAEPKRGGFIHIELASTDPERTKKFFEDVFDWEFQGIPEMSYHTYKAPSGPGGGLMRPMENQSPGILNYLLSGDIDTDVKRIEEAGGRILQPKMEIQGVGWWTLFQEPTGITLALFQANMPPPAPRARGRARPRKAARRAAKGRAKGRRRKK